jgi:hypothetical protein
MSRANPLLSGPIPRPLLSRHGDRREQDADRTAEAALSRRHQVGPTAAEAGARAQDRTPGNDGRPLDPDLRSFFEPRFGHNFADVRVHTDSFSADLARNLSSQAFTAGNHIAFGSREYRPAEPGGMRLLAHELSHVVQQSRGDRQLQRKFVATGSAADFAKAVNAILGVQNEIRVSASGEVSIAATNVQGPPTQEAAELLATIRTVVNDPKNTTMEFIHGTTSTRPNDRHVIVGNYTLSRLDLDDVAAFGSARGMGDNAAVEFVHEITEQYRKQVHGEAFPEAHQAGYAAQERLMGAKLLRESPMTPIPGGSQGEVTTTYRYPDGREVDVITRIDFTTGGIVNVKRVQRP